MAPEQVFSDIIDKFAQQGNVVDWNYTGPENFQSASVIRLPDNDLQRIIDAYKRFSGVDITP